MSPIPEAIPIILSKNTLDVLRTTGRNNVQLINIADNKANILMSLNAIMITFLMPVVLTHIDVIEDQHLYLPLILLTITCFVTILICGLVLRPAQLHTSIDHRVTSYNLSPFFFGNFHKMNAADYLPFVKKSLNKKSQLTEYILQDHFLVGKVLATKYVMLRMAFQLFLTGFILTIVTSLMVLILF